MANEIQERLGLQGGLSALFEGPSGTGKSWACGSIAEFGKTHVCAFDPKEVDSARYRDPNVEVDLFHDAGWSPSINRYEAGAFLDWMEHAYELMNDDSIDHIVIDSLTSLHHAIKHEILAKEAVGRINDLSDPRGAWGDVRELWEETADTLIAFQMAPTPKNLLATVHTQLPNEDDQEARGTEFLGTTRPAIQGSYRNILEQKFHLVLHNRVINEFDPDEREQIENYVVEVRADPDRHSKVAVAPKLRQKTLPNEFSAIVEAIEEAQDESN